MKNTNNPSISDRDFFGSRRYNDFLYEKAKNICTGIIYSLRFEGFDISKEFEVNLLNNLNVRSYYDPSSSITAFAQEDIFGRHKTVVINAGNELINGIKDRNEKHSAILGMLYHEISHLLFTDFPSSIRWGQDLAKWVEGKPCRANSLNSKYWDLSKDTFDNVQLIDVPQKEFRAITAKIMQGINNSIEDGYIERECTTIMPGRPVICLARLNLRLIDNCESFSEALDNGTPVFLAVLNQLLMYSKFKSYKIDNWGFENQELEKKLITASEILDEVEMERSPQKKFQAVNDIVYLFKEELNEYIKQYIEDQEKTDGSSANKEISQNETSESAVRIGSGSGSAPNPNSGEPSDASTSGSKTKESNDQGNSLNDIANGNPGWEKNIMEQLEKIINQTASHDDSKDCQSRSITASCPKDDSSRSENGEKGSKGGNSANQSGAGLGPTDEKGEKEIASLSNQIAKDKEKDKKEKEKLDEMNRDALKTNLKQYGNRSDPRVKVERTTAIPTEYIFKYEMKAKNLLPISRDLQRSIKRVLEEKKNTGPLKNQPFGQRLEITSVIHQDGKYFSKKKLPIQKEKLGVALLIDQSGSTSGTLISAAANTAIIIEDFCRNLKIPHIIYGYTTGYASGTIRIDAYCDRGNIDNSDRYRLIDICSGGGTPTAGALAYTIKRSEKLNCDKLITIVITDGVSGDNVKISESETLISSMMKAEKKKKNKIIVAGIGQDKENIKREFGDENFLDISDLTQMPVLLTKIIKQKM